MSEGAEFEILVIVSSLTYSPLNSDFRENVSDEETITRFFSASLMIVHVLISSTAQKISQFQIAQYELASGCEGFLDGIHSEISSKETSIYVAFGYEKLGGLMT